MPEMTQDDTSLGLDPGDFEKHNGKLDTYHEAKVYFGDLGKFQGVHTCIEHEYGGITTRICLLPKQALSLLAWLLQERATLEQLVKESE